MRYELEITDTFPKALLPGKLYYSPEFKTSRHLCACGCGDVIRLPIDELHHHLTEGPNGPTLRPSIGNWNVCDAHYYITDGEVEWSGKMSQQKIAAARYAEDRRRELYFKSQDTILRRIRRTIRHGTTSLGQFVRGFFRRGK